jgi:hypothetical protein
MVISATKELLGACRRRDAEMRYGDPEKRRLLNAYRRISVLPVVRS